MTINCTTAYLDMINFIRFVSFGRDGHDICKYVLQLWTYSNHWNNLKDRAAQYHISNLHKHKISMSKNSMLI